MLFENINKFDSTLRCDYNVPSFMKNGRDLRERLEQISGCREDGNYRLAATVIKARFRGSRGHAGPCRVSNESQIIAHMTLNQVGNKIRRNKMSPYASYTTYINKEKEEGVA